MGGGGVGDLAVTRVGQRMRKRTKTKIKQIK